MEKSRDGKDSDLQGGGLESAFLSNSKGEMRLRGTGETEGMGSR
jgi:hypothetical protein